MIIKNEALKYLEYGMSVDILMPREEIPMNKNWANSKINTKESLLKEFEKVPQANVGVRLGENTKIGENYLYVIELHIRTHNPQHIEQAYGKLEEIYKDFDKLPCVRGVTQQSKYFYFLSKLIITPKKGIAKNDTQMPVLMNGIECMKNVWQIDLMGTGSHAILPPSNVNNREYTWADDKNICDYLDDEAKKSLMIINNINLLKLDFDTKEVVQNNIKVLDNSYQNIEVSKIEESLNMLDNSYREDYDKWLSIGTAMHQEFHKTENEFEAIMFYENWSAVNPKYKRGDAAKVWKTFVQKDDGLTLGSLLHEIKKDTKEDGMTEFSRWLNGQTNFNPNQLKEAIVKYELTGYMLDIFAEEISKKLSVPYKPKFSLVDTRKILSGLKREINEDKEEKEARLEIGLDDTLARIIIKENFDSSNHILSQGDQVFVYQKDKGFWLPILNEHLLNLVYEHICRIVQSTDEKYTAINKIIFKKKRNDDMNGLTEQITQTIKKITYDATEKLDIMRKREVNFSVINTKNKTLFIENNVLTVENHSYDNYLLTSLNVDYDPNATCPTFMKALDNVFQDLPDKTEVARHFCECIGLSIQTKKKYPMYMLLLGGGNNGKTFVMQQISKLIGEDSVLSVSISEFTKDSFGTSDLFGKLMLIDDDFKKNDTLDDGFLKKTSEEKMITGNAKYKRRFNFKAFCTSVILSNHDPKNYDRSNGTVRRAMCFPFIHTFIKSEQDMKMGEKIALERSGILNLLIKSYMDLEKREGFSVPTSCEQRQETWLNSSSPLHNFIKEKLTITQDDSDVISGQSVFNTYRTYMENTNNQVLSIHKFYGELENIPGIKKSFDAHKKSWLLQGVRLNLVNIFDKTS